MRTNRLSLKLMQTIFLSWMILLVTNYPIQVLAQGSAVENFTNLGLIGISDKYTLPEKINSIVFRIKNNSSRTISNIYGWVYRYDIGPNNKGKNFVLMNNPHKGGTITKGKPHLPGTISEWSFPLVTEPPTPNAQLAYTLRVHSRSIFFANVETGKKATPPP